MRTRDINFIDSILKHPDVYPYIGDDGFPYDQVLVGISKGD